MKRIYLQKAKHQIARPKTIRGINRQIVLNYVRERAPISRAEIARETNLQRSTVSAIVEDLQRDGLIEEIGSGDSTGGRKPTLLKLKTGIPVALGIDVTPRKITIALCDLSGHILDKEVIPISRDQDFVSRQILSEISNILARHNDIPDGLGVGISLPGITDQPNCESLYIPYFDWVGWDIAKRIEEEFGLDVIIDNDANAIALAELWFGKEKIRKYTHFVAVLIADGIGTGMIFDGQIYRGEKGAAGEFGHMIVGGEGVIQCSCGSYDCWEAHASEKAIIARYHKKHNSSPSSTAGFDMNQLMDLASIGEEQSLESLKETAKYLGAGLSNLIVGLSPQAIVISGAIIKVWDLISDDVHSFAKRGIRRDLPETDIIPSSLGEDPTLTGALSLVLSRRLIRDKKRSKQA
jgi:predicted NBD/HSP70 family sugar kinase